MTTIEDHGFIPGPFMVLEIDSITIAQWVADAMEDDNPSQVHILVKVIGIQHPMVMRFKSPDTLGVIIKQLIRYRHEAWPGADPILMP